MKLAQAGNPFGQISPPPGIPVPNGDASAALGTLIATGIRLFIIVAGLFMLLYLLWGAWDWITSSGEKEKLTKARQKITNALIGFILIFVALTVFVVVTGQITNVITVGPNGLEFHIPSVGGTPSGGAVQAP